MPAASSVEGPPAAGQALRVKIDLFLLQSERRYALNGLSQTYIELPEPRSPVT